MYRILFFLLLLSSCNLKPRYTRPEMDIGQNYRFESENSTDYANLPWWKQFQDPYLDQLIEIALENNQDLKVASARVMEFYAKYKVVFSQFFPEITGEGYDDRIRVSRDINYGPIPPGIPSVNNLYSLILKCTYEIDFWGRIRNASEAAKSIYLSEINARRNVILTLVTSVATSYVLLKQYTNQLKIATLTYDSRMEALKIATLRFEGGIVSELDVRQAESEALAAQAEMINFEILVAKQEDLLSVLLGQAPGPILPGVELAKLTMPPEVPAGLPSDLLENRPDILQAEQLILAANADIGVARAAFLPTFTLNGDFGQLSTNTQTFFDNQSNVFDLAPKVFAPLFTGWRITNNLNEKEAAFLQVLHSYQQTILTALKEVSDALIDHQKTKEKLIIQNERIVASREYLKLANLRYFNGQNDYLTVLDAEKALFTTQLEAATTQGDLFLSLVALYKALGQGWDVVGESL